MNFGFRISALFLSSIRCYLSSRAFFSMFAFLPLERKLLLLAGIGTTFAALKNTMPVKRVSAEEDEKVSKKLRR